jgi:hypothetical protein
VHSKKGLERGKKKIKKSRKNLRISGKIRTFVIVKRRESNTLKNTLLTLFIHHLKTRELWH